MNLTFRDRFALAVVATLAALPLSAGAQAVVLRSLTVERTMVPCDTATKATIQLEKPATVDSRIAITSSSGVIDYPLSIKVDAGESTAKFWLRAKPTTAPTDLQVTASFQRQVLTLPLRVEPPASPAVHLRHRWMVGGGIGWGRVELYRPVEKPTIGVSLTSSDPLALAVPAQLTIPFGGSGVVFEFRTFPVATARWVTVQASVLGQNYQTRILVRPPLVGSAWRVIGTNPNPLNEGGRPPSRILEGATTSITSRISHQAAMSGRNSVQSVRLVYANIDSEEGLGERPGDNPITIKACLEKAAYGSSTIPVTFQGGATTVTIAPGGFIVSDPVAISLQRNERFFTRTMQSIGEPDGTMCGGMSTVAELGEGLAVGDATHGEWTQVSSQRGAFSPVAILAYSASPLTSVALCGDSIMEGAGDGGFRTGAGGIGERAVTMQLDLAESRQPQPLGGYLHLARGSETAAMFLDSELRFELSCLATTVVTNYITTDLGSYDSDRYPEAMIRENLVNLARRWLARGVRVVATTSVPRTNASNGFVDAGSQRFRANEWLRTALNDWMRSPSGFVAATGASPSQVLVWDIAKAVEVDSENRFTQNGGRWYSSPIVIDEGTVTQSTGTGNGFLDKTARWPSNSLSGRCVTFLGGANAGRTRCIGWNSLFELATRTHFPAVPLAGDSFFVSVGISTIDGIHPSSEGHAAIARGFPFAEVFGY